MFRVEFFCDDKRLAEALRSLAGVAIGDPKAQPVTNGENKNGAVVALDDGNVAMAFVRYAKTHKLTSPVAEDFRDFCRYLGKSQTSYMYYRKKLIELGALKRRGKGKSVQFTVAS